MRFLPVNSRSLLVELEDLPQTLALLDGLQAADLVGVEELVPAARTILVVFEPALIGRQALVQAISFCGTGARAQRDGNLVEIPVRYEGEDLDEVAALLGLTRAEVVERHTGSLYSVAFTGFAPGFAYLAGGDPVFDVPRRKVPRTRIAAGSVGLAGRFSGVYPQASPGGWQIIGVTDLPMWDLARAVPALLQPGARVRFVDLARQQAGWEGGHGVQARTAQSAVTDAAVSCQAAGLASSTPDTGASGQGGDSRGVGVSVADVTARKCAGQPALIVRQTGLQALFQDLGRPGQAGQGVAASGAMDVGALREANRLVGNVPGAVCMELAYGGFEAECRRDLVVAVTGADVPLTLRTRDGVSWSLDSHRPLALSDGDRLHVGQPVAGVRAYLAVRGGFEVAPVLGSCSTDTLAHVGPAPVAAGDVVAVQPVVHGCVGEPSAPRSDLPRQGEVVVLDVVMGPRTDWFAEAAVAMLAAQDWEVTSQSNRVGMRLHGGEPLVRAIGTELPSEGTVVGAIQVPPSGQPVLFLADRPLTGGYPVIACVARHHLDRAGQVPVGAKVRFNPLAPFSPIPVSSAFGSSAPDASHS